MDYKILRKKHIRIKFNQERYDYVFDEESKELLKKTEEGPSLLRTIEAWLERTPGLATYDYTESGNKIEDNFLLKEYEKSVNRYLKDTYVTPAEVLLNNKKTNSDIN